MAIVKMNKFMLLTFEAEKERILEELQKFGAVEFINLQKEELLEQNFELKELKKDEISKENIHYEEKISKIKSTLEFLHSYIAPKSTLKDLKDGKKNLSFSELKDIVEKSSWEKVYESLKEKEQRLSAIDSEVSRLKTEIETLKPWSSLEFELKYFKSLKYTIGFLGTVPKELYGGLVNEITNENKYSFIEVIHEDSKYSYMMLISHKEYGEVTSDVLRKYGFSNFSLTYEGAPEDIIKAFDDDIRKLTEEKGTIVSSVKEQGKSQELLQMAYEYYSNILIRLEASENFLKTERVVTIWGWIPEDKNIDFEKVISDTVGNEYYLSFSEVQDQDIEEVPIKLKNNDFVSSFESITEMYSMPRYNEIDPTPLLAPFYFVFFGMMVADVGYGILTLIASIIALRAFNLDESKKKMVKFFFYLSISTIAFGAIFGSFFGDAIKIPALLNQTEDINTILIMSVAMGVVQIFFGLFIKAYMIVKSGDPLGAFYDVGSWILALVGTGIFIGGKFLGVSPAVVTIAMYVMLIGMFLIIFMSGRHVKNFGIRIGSGMYALYGITSYIGDLVSYTRLMALGLAGGSLANSFNLIVRMLPGAAIFIIGPIFFVLFHIFNMLLGMLGAYVHTCRLQYVEFFGKFYVGGGRAFTPFRGLNKYFVMKKD